MDASFKSNSNSIALHLVKWRALVGWLAVWVIWLDSWSRDYIHLLASLWSVNVAEPPHSLGESAALLSNEIHI